MSEEFCRGYAVIVGVGAVHEWFHEYTNHLRRIYRLMAEDTPQLAAWSTGGET